MLLIGMIELLFVFSLLGMEIAWAIGIACFGYLALSQFADNPTPMVLFAQQMTVGVDAFVLLAIPLFIFAGELMNSSGVTHRIVRFAASLVGHLNGGLANVAVTANFIMSGCSGSALADCAATGTVLLPEMKERGFRPAFASAVIAAAATVGPIVPPSISFVLLGAIVNISSLRSYTAAKNYGEYCISKTGLSMVTQLFAARLAEYGINVYEIRPAIIDTEMTRRESVRRYYDGKIEAGMMPINRWGKPEEVAQAVGAIARGDFPFSTGAVFHVDGGWHLRQL